MIDGLTDALIVIGRTTDGNRDILSDIRGRPGVAGLKTGLSLKRLRKVRCLGLNPAGSREGAVTCVELLKFSRTSRNAERLFSVANRAFNSSFGRMKKRARNMRL